MSEKTKPSSADYEKLGRTLEGVLINDYLYLIGNTKRQIWQAFVRGVLTGLGGVVGATVIVALLVWILHLLGGIPFIGHFLNNTGHQIQTK